MKVEKAFWNLFYYSCDKCGKLLEVVVGKITRKEHLEILEKHKNHQCEVLNDLHCKLCKCKIRKGWKWCRWCGIWLEEVGCVSKERDVEVK